MSLKRKTVTWLRKKSSVDPGNTILCYVYILSKISNSKYKLAEFVVYNKDSNNKSC